MGQSYEDCNNIQKEKYETGKEDREKGQKNLRVRGGQTFHRQSNDAWSVEAST